MGSLLTCANVVAKTIVALLLIERVKNAATQ
jgi:hypothetical protein